MDVKSEFGRNALDALVSKADILVQNLAPAHWIAWVSVPRRCARAFPGSSIARFPATAMAALTAIARPMTC